MFGGVSSKFGPASFAPPSTPPVPASFKEWKSALNGVKGLYLQRQYKQCAARCTDLLMVAKQDVHSTRFGLMNYSIDLFSTD